MAIFSRTIDYKKELENAAKGMIKVHEPQLLIRMIARMIVHRVNVSHAGILLHNKEKNTYVLTVSRGPAGIKIPAGFARLDYDSALIRFFIERYDTKIFNEGYLVYSLGKKALLNKKLRQDEKELLQMTLEQMDIFGASVCIPSYFDKELLGLLLLGRKNNGREFLQSELDFFSALASDVAMAIRNAQLFQQLSDELDKKQRLFIHTTVALAAAIDAKDHYTHGHTSRVTELSLKIAKCMLQDNNCSDLSDKFFEDLHIASLLHDIGKIGIPESILNKNGPLNDEERKIMQSHPLVGAAILAPIKELNNAISGVKYHHEKYDGSGYPEGLKGEDIPLIASVISIADAFDAMTTDRPYRKGFSKEQAVREIESLAGSQFNPEIARIFIGLCRGGEIN